MKKIHHLGLSVSDLKGTSWFFCELLGWRVVQRVDEYPAIFVSNGSVTFTLWQTSSDAHKFDRHNNVGLHHVALQIETEIELSELYEKLKNAEGVSIEFSPEFLKGGPSKHMICYEPSGIRVEFIWIPE